MFLLYLWLATESVDLKPVGVYKVYGMSDYNQDKCVSSEFIFCTVHVVKIEFGCFWNKKYVFVVNLFLNVLHSWQS